MVHVVDEAVQRLDALSQTRLDDRPFARRQDPRNRIERQDALGGVVLTVRVDGERHAAVQERPVGELRGAPKLRARHGRDLGDQLGVVRTRNRRTAGIPLECLVVEAAEVVARPEHAVGRRRPLCRLALSPRRAAGHPPPPFLRTEPSCSERYGGGRDREPPRRLAGRGVRALAGRRCAPCVPPRGRPARGRSPRRRPARGGGGDRARRPSPARASPRREHRLGDRARRQPRRADQRHATERGGRGSQPQLPRRLLAVGRLVHVSARDRGRATRRRQPYESLLTRRARRVRARDAGPDEARRAPAPAARARPSQPARAPATARRRHQCRRRRAEPGGWAPDRGRRRRPLSGRIRRLARRGRDSGDRLRGRARRPSRTLPAPPAGARGARALDAPPS